MKFTLKVNEIPKKELVDFVQKYHYSPVFPKLTKHWLGIYDDNLNLVGCLTLGWGTQPKQTIQKLFPTLDTKDYLLPQNRERIYIVGFKDNVDFEFAPKQELKLRLKDMLEDSVDSKYLLNQELVEKYLTTGTASNHKGSQAGKVVDENNDTFHTVNAGTHGYSMGYVKLNQTHQLKIKGNDSIKRIYSSDGLCPSLTTMQGGYREPKVALLIKEEFETNAEVAPNNYIFRKLTERECFRLQGFDDSFIFPPKISSTQLYKQAGNGMSRNILKMLFTQILIAYTKHIEGKQNENI